MRRTSNRERYMDRVALIREHVPDCAITTDIIVGFPGASDAELSATLGVVEVVQRRAREHAQRVVGRTLDVLVEGQSRNDPSKLCGCTTHNKVVNFEGLARPGDIVPVQISSATSQTLA